MRIIARLDVKNEFVIKGIHLEGLRKIGDPNQLAKRYYQMGVDEIVFMDAVASLYDRNNLYDVIEKACKDIFVPIAVGGGIRNLEDVSKALGVGADKVIVNTGLIQDRRLIGQIAHKFGSQCLVGSIEAKNNEQSWRAYIDNGREPTKWDVIEWAKILEEEGCGEILLTSIDQEGTKRGFDINLVEQVNCAIKRPLIVSGGYGKIEHLNKLFSITIPSAVAFASVLHYENCTVSELREVTKNEY